MWENACQGQAEELVWACWDLPPHTHYRKQRHENKHSRMQGKRSKVENFPSEERKQSKNHCSPVKLESKKKKKIKK